MDYSAWKFETLKAEFVALGQEYARIGTIRSEMLKEIEFRERVAFARTNLQRLPEPIKDALRSELAKG